MSRSPCRGVRDGEPRDGPWRRYPLPSGDPTRYTDETADVVLPGVAPDASVKSWLIELPDGSKVVLQSHGATVGLGEVANRAVVELA